MRIDVNESSIFRVHARTYSNTKMSLTVKSAINLSRICASSSGCWWRQATHAKRAVLNERRGPIGRARIQHSVGPCRFWVVHSFDSIEQLIRANSTPSTLH